MRTAKTEINFVGGQTMRQPTRIGIIGDFNANSPSHKATNDALSHAADVLSLPLNVSWVPTESLDSTDVKTVLKPFDALWCAPGSPYASMNGALNAILFARENGVPFFAT
jgi:CTP synthase (UTP-ammonia lyase)